MASGLKKINPYPLVACEKAIMRPKLDTIGPRRES